VLNTLIEPVPLKGMYTLVNLITWHDPGWRLTNTSKAIQLTLAAHCHSWVSTQPRRSKYITGKPLNFEAHCFRFLANLYRPTLEAGPLQKQKEWQLQG
jgi:hypothetical protein